ncbi:MAG: carotenoid biosynthesis protein [Myxococcales bacterium]|nr:carotenoid biosynthesis protein [Myxococcales bacterium]
MITLQLFCLAIVLLYIVVRARMDEQPSAFLARYVTLVVAAWLAEDSVIRAYGFYSYSEGWSLFIDHVPLAIVMIWPVVIHSAWDLARCLVRQERHGALRLALVSGLVVLADAWLIEPIAVQSGLWRWSEPGLFQVPPIGVLGWSFFAVLAVWLLEQRRLGRWRLPLLVVLAPVGVHPLLLAAWWGAFRWINVTVPAWPAVATAWLLGAIAALRFIAGARRHDIPLWSMLLRVPAAGFFFVLLARQDSAPTALYVYAVAFAPPYLALTAFDALFSRKRVDQKT